MSDSPLQKKPNEKEADIQFTTDNIGRWASRQENPFAEQNRKEQAKKQERAKKRKKFSPIVIISASAIAIIAAVVGLVFLIIYIVNRPVPIAPPTIAGSTMQDISDYRDLLQNLFNQNNGTNEDKRQEINQTVDGSLSTNNGKENAAAIILAQASFYLNNGVYDEALRAASTIDPEQLPLEQQVLYYNILCSGNSVLGNEELANKYSAIMYDIVDQLGGIGG